MTPTLGWSVTSLAGSYTLQVSTSANFATTVTSISGISGITQQFSSPSDSTEYYWRVAAANAAGTGPWSPVWNFTTIPNIPAAVVLSSPVNGTQNSLTTLTLAWSVTPKAASFAVQVSTSADFSSTVMSLSGLSGFSQPIGPLANSVEYYWHAAATNAAGTGMWSSAWNFATIATPVLVSPTSGAGNISIAPNFSWSSVPTANSYHLDVSTSSNFATTVYSQGSLTGTSQTVSGLFNATAYYWRVGAKNATGISGWSNVSSFTTITVPLLVSPAGGAPNVSISPILA